MNSLPLTGSPDQSVRPLPGNGDDLNSERRGSAFSRLISMWTVYALTLRQHLHGRRWMVMTGLFLLAIGLGILVRTTSPDVSPRETEFIFVFAFIPQAILPLLALVYASGIVRDEQEEQTMTYLLIRPVPKWGIYTTKLLATLTTTVVLTAVLTSLLFVAIYAGAGTEEAGTAMRCVKAIEIHSLAVITYCCLFGLISLLTPRALIVGILYTVIFEGLVANLPLSIRLATVIYYTRVIAYRTLSFVVTRPWYNSTRQTDLAADFWQFDLKTDPKLLTHPQTGTCVLVLLGVSLACTVLAAILFSRNEFYVKTPEKS